MPLLLAGVLAAQLGGDSCETLLSRAKSAFEARDLKAAASAFESASRVCSNRSAVLVPLAQTQYLLGEEQAAEKSLLAAIESAPTETQPRYALGRIYYQQHRYPEAEAQYQEVLRRDPKDYRTWDNLALCYDALQRDADAIKAFFRALDLVKTDHPDYDWAYANFADFFLRRNEFEKAFQLAAEAAKRNPQSARNAFLTGKALVKLEKSEISERWLKRAVELDPGYTEAHYLLAQTYRKLGRNDEAAKALEAFKKANETPRPRR